MKGALLLVWAVLSVILAAAVRGDGEARDGEPVIGVDSMGNLHINTTSSNTTVYVNGGDVGELREMVASLMSQQSTLVSQQAAQSTYVKLACRTWGRFSQQEVITTSAAGAFSVFYADLDGDGDEDVLSASNVDDKIAWYENEDSLGTFSQQKVITTSADSATSVFAADFDGDGDMDVLSASQHDDKIAWYENTDGLGTFSSQKVITTSADSATSVFAADLDGDGDIDVLSASQGDDKIAWYENTDGLGSFSSQKVITTSADGARSVFAADLDGDGDIDVLSASEHDDKVAWYENDDGLGTFSQQKVIFANADSTRAVFAADLDGDGDVDVLSASVNDDKVAWYENENGLGTFSDQKVITTSADGAHSVFAADVDGDGDVDVLGASREDNTIAWYENEDGLGTFSQQKVITTSADRAYSVSAADIDGDGDMDVLSASLEDDKIAWYENLC